MSPVTTMWPASARPCVLPRRPADPARCRHGGRLAQPGHPLRSVRDQGRRERGVCMRYRSLGNSGLVVSVAGLGCNNFGRRLDLDATRAVVDAALEAGVTLLDTADMYGSGGGSEELLGQVLTGRRDEVV